MGLGFNLGGGGKTWGSQVGPQQRQQQGGFKERLVGMISPNHLITYITAAACSAVCQRACVCVRTWVCFQSISVYLHLCLPACLW